MAQRKAMRGRQLVACLAALVALLASGVPYLSPAASQSPTPPHRFQGNVTVNGAPAPAGPTVTATISGNVCGQTTVTTDSTYVVDVVSSGQSAGCGTEGATVSFTVDGSPAGSGTWTSGGKSWLDLAASTAPTPSDRFQGNVTINGAPAPAGATVTATIGGTICGQTTVNADSTYTLDVVSSSQTAGCATEGATVTFAVDGSPAASATWSSGQFTDLDLAASTPPNGAAPDLPHGPQWLQASAQCSARYPGRAVATFQWPPVGAASSQWLDLSLFDNNFAPGTFIGAGPLTGEASSFTWDDLAPDSVHYWRINSVVSRGWQASYTATVVTPRCIPGAATQSEVRQECSTTIPGAVQVEFTWEPSPWAATQQWVDLSLQENDFLPGTFIGGGPLPPFAGSLWWDGLKPGLPHYWRVNTMLAPSVWVSSETDGFITLPCPPSPRPPMPSPTRMAAPTRTPTSTAVVTPTPTATPTLAPRTVVIFLRGLGSSVVGGAETPRDSFATIKSSLRNLGYGSLDFVEYSYAGPVSVDYQVGSRFHFSGPDYACPATAQDANTSVFTLRDSLDTIAGAYNGNVRFALVGHSLGGLIAVLGMSQPLVETVVTLDSPLMGVGAGKASVADFFGCSGPVLGELGGMEASGTWPGEMEELVRQFRAQGGRIATLGNEHDCYYDPCVCFLLLCPLFVDETMTQVIPNADDPQLYRLGSDESWGHRDILSDTTIANFMASFIGPP